MISALPSVAFAGVLGLLAIVPALAPRDGERLGIWVPPWSSSTAIVSRIAATDARMIAISDRFIVIEGGPGLPSQLRRRGIFHAVVADAVLCSTREPSRPTVYGTQNPTAQAIEPRGSLQPNADKEGYFST